MPKQSCNFYELEMIHLNAENRSTMTKILNLLDENYLEFGKSGKKTQKKDYLSASLPADQYEILEFESHSLGKKSQLTTYTLWNHTTDEKSLRSSVWKYQNSSWKLYFHQGTPVN